MAASLTAKTWFSSIKSYVNTRRLCRTASSIPCTEHSEALVLGTTPWQLLDLTHSSNRVNMIEVNSPLRELVKAGQLHIARQMFEKMSHKDEVSWTIMISGYVSAMNPAEALILFSHMWVQPGLSMDPFVLSVALKACGLNFSVKYGEALHGYSVKSSFVNSVFVGSALLDMYTKAGKIEEGCRVFDEMPIRNVVSWTAIITGLVRAGCNQEALLYFSEMWRSRVVCDSYTFAIALKACAVSGCLNYGREIHSQILKRGFDVTSFVANSLSTMYNKCGKLDYGLCLFRRMSTPDVVSWTALITSYVQLGLEEQALEAFIRMTESGVKPNEFTFAAVFSGCAGISRVEWGEQIHAHVFRLGLADSLSVANSIMSMYSKCGRLSSASLVFHGMRRRDVISWSTIIGGFCQGGCGEEAFEYLSQMRRGGPKPNEFALASVLSVCGSMAILEQGRQVHAHVLSIGLDQIAMVQSALINMYSKCGSIREAAKIFDEGEKDDIVSWTAMISGFAEHGYSKEAIDLFKKIPTAGLKPDSVAFIGVLTACSHAGLVDLGFNYFNSIRSKYQVNPSKEHYGCMIDLLCRAGRLKDAEQMINDMPCKKDDVVWSTLLRACRLDGDIDCGRRTAEKILELDPVSAGAHITLANIYSAKGKWKEAADVRKMMKLRGLIKEPGWSWIKMKNEVSAFVAGDSSHPQGEEIYNVLDLLASGTETTSRELNLLNIIDS